MLGAATVMAVPMLMTAPWQAGEGVGGELSSADGQFDGGWHLAGGDGGDGGVVNVYELHVMALVNRMALQRCRQSAVRLLRLNHRTLAASAGDSGKVVMGVVVGGKVLGDVVSGRRCRVALSIRSISPVQLPSKMSAIFLLIRSPKGPSGQFLSVSCPLDVNDLGQDGPKTLASGACRGRILDSRCLAFPAFPLPRNLGA